MSYARAGSSPAFGTNIFKGSRIEGLVRPWPGALSPAFGANIFSSTPLGGSVLIYQSVVLSQAGRRRFNSPGVYLTNLVSN